MLLSARDYRDLCGADEGLAGDPAGLLSYVLDPSENARDVAEEVRRTTGLASRQLLPTGGYSGAAPTVHEWRRSFHDAQYVVTDSFHGTVFSIIFNKPFVVVANTARGRTRFDSLLTTFGLDDRLVTRASEVSDELVHAPIDWRQVNSRIAAESSRSLHYLREHLVREPAGRR